MTAEGSAGRVGNFLAEAEKEAPTQPSAFVFHQQHQTHPFSLAVTTSSNALSAFPT
jgi:hypothetical protein